KPQLLLVLAATVLSSIFSILSPKILGLAITKLFEGMMLKLNNVPGASVDFPYIMQILFILAGLYFTSSLFTYLQQFMIIGVTQKTVFILRNDINNKLASLPIKFFDNRTHGEILSRVINDVDIISYTMQQSITQIISAIV